MGPEAVELSGRAGLALEPHQADGVDLMLSVRDDGQWACFEFAEICARQNGKTVGIFAPRALAALFLLGERLVMWSAHEYKTVLESFLHFRGLIETLGVAVGPNLVAVGDTLVKVSNTNGEEGFERLDTGQRIKFIARSKYSGRGFSGDVNLIDEAAFGYTRSHQDALLPTLLARPNPQICYASSPPLTGEGDQPLYALRERAEAGDDALGWRDWGLSGDLETRLDCRCGSSECETDHRIDLDDRALWRPTNPALRSGRLTEEKIERARRSLSRIGFAREILCIWPRKLAAGGGVIDPLAFAALADPDSVIAPGSPMVFALDASPGLASGTIGVAGRRRDGMAHVEITGRDGVADHRPGVGWMVPRAVALAAQWEPVAWVLDPAGPAGALLADLREAGIDPHLVTGRELGQACGSLLTMTTAPERDRYRHLDQQPLLDAVAAAKKRDIGDGAWAWGRKASADDISPLVAATLALHGLAVHGTPTPEPAAPQLAPAEAGTAITSDLREAGF